VEQVVSGNLQVTENWLPEGKITVGITSEPQHPIKWLLMSWRRFFELKANDQLESTLADLEK